MTDFLMVIGVGISAFGLLRIGVLVERARTRKWLLDPLSKMIEGTLRAAEARKAEILAMSPEARKAHDDAVLAQRARPYDCDVLADDLKPKFIDPRTFVAKSEKFIDDLEEADRQFEAGL